MIDPIGSDYELLVEASPRTNLGSEAQCQKLTTQRYVRCIVIRKPRGQRTTPRDGVDSMDSVTRAGD